MNKSDYKKAWDQRVSKTTAHCEFDDILKQENLFTCFKNAFGKDKLANKTIVDLGCGGGLLGLYLNNNYKINKYIGLDISDRSIDFAKKNLSQFGNVELKLIDPDNIKIDHVDILCCFSVIQHMPDLNYFNYFLSKINESKIEKLYLQIKYSPSLQFRDKPYKTTVDIGNACFCNDLDINIRLKNYKLTKISEHNKIGDYVYLTYRVINDK